MNLTLKLRNSYILTIFPFPMVALYYLRVVEMVGMITYAFENVLNKFVILNILEIVGLTLVSIL